MAGKLLDTTVLIDLSRGKIAAAEFVDNERQAVTELFVSVISAMELIVGCRNKAEVAKAEKQIAEFKLVQLNPAISIKNPASSHSSPKLVPTDFAANTI